MKRIHTSIESVKTDILNFYKADKHHFIVMNAVILEEKIEIQWFFADYEAPGEVTVFFALVNPTDELPSIKEIIPSAWVSEAELVDLLDLNIENTNKGFVLETDSETAPLRK
jgi:ech hydrogenase subunit D